MKRKVILCGLLVPTLLLTGCSLLSKSVSSDEFLEKTKNPDPHPYTKAILTYYSSTTTDGETKEINSEEEYTYNASQSTWDFTNGDTSYGSLMINMNAHDYAELINMPGQTSSYIRQYYVNPYKINDTEFTNVGDVEFKSVTKLEFDKYCLLTKLNSKETPIDKENKYEDVLKVTVKYSK